VLDLKAASPALASDAKSEAREIDSICEARSFRPSTEQIQDTPIDPQRVFLLHAAIRHELVERGEESLDTAFGELVEPFSEIVGFPVCDICGSQPCVNPSFCESCRRADRLRKPPSAEIRLLRGLMPDNVSLAAAIAQIERRRGRR
jgi:hypothetical protein